MSRTSDDEAARRRHLLYAPLGGDEGRRAVTYRGQRYELIGECPHVTRDGRAITLLAWRSHCLDCDEVFETTTAARAPAFKPGARRCAAHRSSRRLAWRDRIGETDPAVAARPLPDGRPVAPVDVYDEQGR